jgi:hypothetical protein
MQKGQIAMLAVKAEGLKLEGEGQDCRMIRQFSYGIGSQLAKLAGCSKDLISDAMLVYGYARELVDEMIAGANPK